MIGGVGADVRGRLPRGLRPNPDRDTGETPERGDPVVPAGEGTWLINAQYSERLNPEIFQIIREFLLTPPP